MKSKSDSRRNSFIGAAFGSTLLLAAACSKTETLPSPTAVAAAQPVIQAPADALDDYDYFPGYETYYSRNRHEYVYRDGNAWVRRSEPRGVTVSALLALPSVRVDFHDSPELHHSSVVRSYPKNWAPPGKRLENRGNHGEDGKDDRKSDDRRN